jgi:hypothetical protein
MLEQTAKLSMYKVRITTMLQRVKDGILWIPVQKTNQNGASMNFAN